MSTASNGGPSAEVLERLAQNHRRFLEFLERRVGSRADAEDILQDGFVRALERGDGLRKEDSSVAWFYRVLRNAVTDHYRRRGARERAMEQAGGREAADGVIEDPEMHDTVCGCVMDLLGTLKPEYAEAVRRVDLDGQGVAEYAAAAGITANNAGVRLHRARESLRRQVMRSCSVCALHGCEDCTCRER